MIVDSDIHARHVLAEFRAATAALGGDAQLIALIEDLSESGEAFATWWPEPTVPPFETRLQRFTTRARER